MLMGNKTHKDIPGIAFLVDSRVAQQRRAEPRESLATVKRLLQSSAVRHRRDAYR
jgi:hypothetical protein